MAEFRRAPLLALGRIALVLVLIVIALGAWTRLRDAGLGCPDWPTCYGHLTVPSSAEALARVSVEFPGQTVEPRKAWPETIHRYFASTLGLVILLIAALSWRQRGMPGLPWRHASGLLALVCLQGAFGALTVTQKLYPPVVTGHLLFGFATLTLLWLWYLRLAQAFPACGDRASAKLRGLALFAALTLALQILLGGWTASNYAASICSELPVCQAGWPAQLDFAEAFRLFRPDDRSFEYAPHLSAAAKLTIHVTHRFGAMFTSAVLLLLAWRLWRQARHPRYRRFAVLILAGLLVQVALGVVNVVAQLPLANAVLHNVWAAVLLQLLVTLVYALRREHGGGRLSWH